MTCEHCSSQRAGFSNDDVIDRRGLPDSSPPRTRVATLRNDEKLSFEPHAVAKFEWGDYGFSVFLFAMYCSRDNKDRKRRSPFVILLL